MTKEELQIQQTKEDVQMDERGQFIIYTGLFRWKNGEIRKDIDPEIILDLENDIVYY